MADNLGRVTRFPNLQARRGNSAAKPHKPDPNALFVPDEDGPAQMLGWALVAAAIIGLAVTVAVFKDSLPGVW